MTRARTVVVMALAALATPPAVRAQSPPAAADSAPAVSGSIANVTRVESWSFFEPANTNAEPAYTFVGNRSDLAVTARGLRFDLSGGFAYVRLENLPRRAIGPGGLGAGAFYFAATGLPYSYQVFLTDLTVSLHSRDRRRLLTFGRMRYTSGAEGEEEGGPESPVAAVRRLAIDGRVLGTFEWSLYQRRFDGVRAHAKRERSYFGGSTSFVTQGGFEESANLTIKRLLVGTAYAGRHHRRQDGSPVGESQVFAAWYRDRRAIGVRPDNGAVSGIAANIAMTSMGGSHVALREAGRGIVDAAVWGAVQFGAWYGQRHRAHALAAQGGYRWNGAAGRPWVRGGASFASGDRDGRDERHETFFPMLQETQRFAPSMVYAHANLRDLFVQLLAEPRARTRLRADLRRVDLARTTDRWYQGSGATAGNGTFFGYSSRPSGGARDLGTILEGAIDARLSPYWSVNAYAGRMWGGTVVRRLFTTDRLFYWYVENVLRLSVP